jgi:hypothetical protein
MIATISAASTEYVKVAVFATKNGQVVNPTSDTVQMAFTNAPPQTGDWKAASWETAAPSYFARCLVGPSGVIQLAPGTYDVWVKVTDIPEIPVKNAGRLDVTA